MLRENGTTKRLTFSIDEPTRAKLETVANDLDRSLAYVLRLAVADYVSRHEEASHGRSHLSAPGMRRTE